MSNNFILDDVGERDSEKWERRRRFTRWAWISFAILAFFSAMPSYIMYNFSPRQVNDVSPVDAHFLVFSMFGIAAIGLLALIFFLVRRARALR